MLRRSFFSALVYELLYKRVFPELDRKDHSRKGGVQTPEPLMGLSVDLYENGNMPDEFRENGNDDNDGWTEVKSRSQKGQFSCDIIHFDPILYIIK